MPGVHKEVGLGAGEGGAERGWGEHQWHRLWCFLSPSPERALEAELITHRWKQR